MYVYDDNLKRSNYESTKLTFPRSTTDSNFLCKISSKGIQTDYVLYTLYITMEELIGNVTLPTFASVTACLCLG